MNTLIQDDVLRRLHEALGTDQEALCDTIVGRYADEVDAYRAEEQEHGRERMLSNVWVQLQSMRESLELPPGHTFTVPRVAVDVARGRAEEGFPLEAVLQAYHIATQCIWEWMNHAESLRDDHQAIIEVGWPKWLVYVDRAMRVAANAYVGAAQERARLDVASRRHFLAMLLAGQLEARGLQRWLAVLGHSDVRGHLLVALRWNDGDQVAVSELSDRIAVRVLDQVAPGLLTDAQPIATVVNDHAALLVPMDTLSAARVRRALAQALAEVVPADVPVVAAISDSLKDLSQAGPVFTLLTQVTSTAVKDREIALLGDMSWFDHAVAAVRGTFDWYRPKQTAQLVDLFSDRTNEAWGPTLEAWFDSSMNVKRAAEALHVHPNTIYYRLGQIERASGVDPRDAAHLIDLIVINRLVSSGPTHVEH